MGSLAVYNGLHERDLFVSFEVIKAMLYFRPRSALGRSRGLVATHMPRNDEQSTSIASIQVLSRLNLCK